MSTLIAMILPVLVGLCVGVMVRGVAVLFLWAMGVVLGLLVIALLSGAARLEALPAYAADLGLVLNALGSFAILLMALLTLVGIEIGQKLKQRKAQML